MYAAHYHEYPDFCEHLEVLERQLNEQVTQYLA